jgi:hypothetical protein
MDYTIRMEIEHGEIVVSEEIKIMVNTNPVPEDLMLALVRGIKEACKTLKGEGQ